MLRPEEAITEIFEKFKVIVSLEQNTTGASEQCINAINDFIREIKKDELGAKLFHLAICVSDTKLDPNALQLTCSSQPIETSTTHEENQPPEKGNGNNQCPFVCLYGCVVLFFVVVCSGFFDCTNY